MKSHMVAHRLEKPPALMLIIVMTGSVFGQDPKPTGPGDHSRTLTVGNRERSYLVHIPPRYDAKQPAPVVLAFHGGGTNADQMVMFIAERQAELGVFSRGPRWKWLSGSSLRPEVFAMYRHIALIRQRPGKKRLSA